MGMTTIFFTFLLLLLLGLDFSTATSITIQPKKLDRSGDNVKIQWSGVPSPSPLDWVGIYSPPSSPDLNFLGYLYLNTSPTWTTGSGHLHLPLTNLRSPYQFRLFRWTKDQIDPKHHDHNYNPLPGTTHRLAVSRDLHFANPNFPDQLHLSFADNHDEMRVMFVSGESSPAIVEYGLDESNLNHKTLTEAHTYDRTHMCDSPANSTTGWRSPGFTHEALLRNLANGKRYFYRVGSNSMGWTSTHTFISRDITANQTIAYLFGDMGTFTPYKTYRRTQKESLSTVKWILRDIAASGDKPSLVSHIGDISYAEGYSWIWDQFFHQIEPIASSVPYHVCMGNHEYDWPLQPWKPSWSYGIYRKDGGGECGVPYSVRFHMPGGDSSIGGGGEGPKTRNIYYSFDEGVVHFLYMSTEMDFLPGSKQYEFIKRDLEGVDRKKTPYVVFQGHRPMYTTSTKFRDGPLRERMLEHLEPLLVENDVTLAMWGHVHLYERFCALRNNTCVDGVGGGPVHLVIGMGGKETQPKWTPLANQKEAPIYPQPERSMYRGGQFGYVRLVATMEKLTVTYVGNHDGQPHDHVEIFSGHGDHSTQVGHGSDGDGGDGDGDDNDHDDANDGNDSGDGDDDDHDDVDDGNDGGDSDDGEGKGTEVSSGFWSYVLYVGCVMFGAAVGYSLRFLVSPSSRRRMGTYRPIGDDGI